MPIDTANSPRKTDDARITRRFRRRLWSLAAPLVALAGATWFLTTTLNRFAPDDWSTRSASATTQKRREDISTKPLWRQWLEAWRTPQTVTKPMASLQSYRAPVWVDVEELARRHPAWQLANRLEAQTAASSTEIVATRFWTSNFSTFDGRQRAFDQSLDSSDANSFWSDFARRANGSNRRDVDADRVLDVADFLDFDARANHNTTRETSLARAAQRQQNAWLDLLNGDLNRDLSRQRRTRAGEARAVLEEEIEAARTAGLTTPDPTLLSEIEQLELTNLRLKLLPSSRLSEQERAQTRERYLILQSRWDEALRRQEAQHWAEIEEQLQSEPRRLRREGESAIAQSQARLQLADNARLRTLLETQNALLQRDFSALQPLSRVSTAPVNSGEINSALNIARLQQSALLRNRFDTASPLPQVQAGFSRSSSGASSHRVLDSAQLDTAPSNIADSLNNRSASGASRSPASRLSDSRRSTRRIGELRAQARREVRLWSQSVARRKGWRLVSSPSNSPSNPPSLRPRNATEDVWRAWR